jgi:hypothetical protein
MDFSLAAYGNGRFVVLSSLNGIAVITSTDGVTWTVQPLPSETAWATSSLVFGNGYFIRRRNGGDVNLSRSTDGINWTKVLNTPGSSYRLAFGENVFVGVAANVGTGTAIISDDNGATWRATNSLPDESGGNWTHFIYGLGKFVAMHYFFDAGVTVASGTPTTPTTTQTLSAPQSLTASFTTSGQASLSWTTPAVNSSPPIIDYIVQYSFDGGSTWTTFTDGTSTATTATVTGLTNGTPYMFRVAAMNNSGISDYSSPSTSGFPPGSTNSNKTVLGSNTIAGQSAHGTPFNTGLDFVQGTTISVIADSQICFSGFTTCFGPDGSSSATLYGLRRYSLVARVVSSPTNSTVAWQFVGSNGSFTAQQTGRLYLGVVETENSAANRTGQFYVSVFW